MPGGFEEQGGGLHVERELDVDLTARSRVSYTNYELLSWGIFDFLNLHKPLLNQ